MTQIIFKLLYAKLTEILLVESWRIAVIYNDETMVRSFQQYRMVFFFLLIEQWGPYNASLRFEPKVTWLFMTSLIVFKWSAMQLAVLNIKVHPQPSWAQNRPYRHRSSDNASLRFEPNVTWLFLPSWTVFKWSAIQLAVLNLKVHPQPSWAQNRPHCHRSFESKSTPNSLTHPAHPRPNPTPWLDCASVHSDLSINGSKRHIFSRRHRVHWKGLSYLWISIFKLSLKM